MTRSPCVYINGRASQHTLPNSYRWLNNYNLIRCTITICLVNTECDIFLLGRPYAELLSEPITLPPVFHHIFSHNILHNKNIEFVKLTAMHKQGLLYIWRAQHIHCTEWINYMSKYIFTLCCRTKIIFH